MVDINLTLFIQMANFLVLIVILNYLLYKPILSILDKRKERLDESENEIKRLNLSVEQKAAEYEEKLRQAKQAALDKKGEILKEAADSAKAIIDEKRGKIPAMLAEFQGRVAKEVDGARQILKSQSEKISAEIAEKVLGRSLQ
ncbi:MAG TPA: ATP synthase F0 subunit B [Syntrophales bacterium]|nr:ATP synthase F0 subunit B [Syntrophales bacterium]HON23644.1 ATP synthase F0 subunit B [Syntrophales bacterium]HOU76731.1 ATP synthase F0 subunit B [Syntrophales bacterium]HPC31854.1 ATP synthase F0 subunit B [Syntrophales bacterium]HQI34689.1 ATP synthase F0 subunit B [Syntrophales bacterium]